MAVIEYSVFSAAQVQCRLGNYAWVKGNQVQVLSDPVTVSGEKGCICHYAMMHEKARSACDPQVRKPADYIDAQLPTKARCNMSL